MKKLGLKCFVIAAVLFYFEPSLVEVSPLLSVDQPSFVIDYDNHTFVKDGVPFRYISGSIHPYRIPKELWNDRLKKYWAAGLNAIQMYIFWNEHEPSPGVYDFEGQNDIFSFMEMAQKIGFVIILRPGPYICGEHDYGALPWWLLANGPENIKPRTSHSSFIDPVLKWFLVLLPKLVPYLYENGGPIVTVQIENEYGFYYACDKHYTNFLKNMMILYLGTNVVYFTTDPYTVLKCGTIPDVFATVDFGIDIDPKVAFAAQRKHNKGKGPYVNSEFYPGWLDFWGTPHQKRDTSQVLPRMNQILALNANLNFYMFHGGTNFGFSNGADPDFSVQPTSYDYDAPISEAGDITQKYLAIRNEISKFSQLPQVPIPANSSKIAYGSVVMFRVNGLVEAIIENANVKRESKYPLSFEKLGQGYGIILYETTLDDPNVDGKILSIPGIRDRGYVQIGDTSVGVLYRINQTELKINLPNNKNNTLYIIVENMGRLNFGNDLLDSKGIISSVTLDGKLLTGWTSYLTSNWIPNFQGKPSLKHSLEVLKEKYAEKISSAKLNSKNKKLNGVKGAAWYFGIFGGSSSDTFLKMDRFTKGLALIQNNDTLINLGRYWPNTGPQVTLYVPGVFTAPDVNAILLLEFEGTSCDDDICEVDFIDYPIIDSIKN